MKGKQYEKPWTKVIELKHSTMLLAGSNTGGVPSMPGYPGGGDPLNPSNP
jgi:hypothetical protein